MSGTKQCCVQMFHWQVLGELLGTFILVFCGTGAMAVDALSGGELGHVGICLVFGLVVTAMIYVVGDISGAHLNPAVTIAFYASQRLRLRCVFPYVAAQCTGALLASLMVRFLFPAAGTLGETLPAEWMCVSGTFALEVLLSFTLMCVIIKVSTGSMEKGVMPGIVVGGAVGLLALLGGQATGASMNPARSLGPAVVAGNFGCLGIYLIAPVAGMLLAIVVCKLLRAKGGQERCEID